MRARLIKMFMGKVAIEINKTFSDVPSLYDFLANEGFNMSPRELAEDLQREEVTYTTALVNTEASSEYQ